jgi:hypothetical protein
VMPCSDSITVKPSETLSTRISKESSICERSAGPVFSHWGQRRFSTQWSREAIPQICICRCSDQHQFGRHNQIRKNVSSHCSPGTTGTKKIRPRNCSRGPIRYGARGTSARAAAAIRARSPVRRRWPRGMGSRPGLRSPGLGDRVSTERGD